MANITNQHHSPTTALEIFTTPSDLSPLSSGTSQPSTPTIHLEKTTPASSPLSFQQVPNAVHFQKVHSVRIPQLIIKSADGTMVTVVKLNPKEQQQLQDYVDKLLQEAEIKGQLQPGDELSSINLEDLYLYVDKNIKPIFLSSQMESVGELRKFCDQKRDPKHKGVYSWPHRTKGMRGTIYGGTPSAFIRPTEHLKTLHLSDADFSNALDHSLNADKPLSHPHKLEALKRRHAAHQLKNHLLGYLDHLKKTDPSTIPGRKGLLENGENKLKEMWQFAVDFEIAHPIFRSKSSLHTTPLLPLLQKKEQAAAALIGDPSKRPLKPTALGKVAHAFKDSAGRETADPKAEKECAKDLARAGIATSDVDVYERMSKELDTVVKKDSFEEAFTHLAIAVETGDGAKIDQAMNGLMFQEFLNALGASDKALIENYLRTVAIPEIQTTFTKAQLYTLPSHLPSDQLIASFQEKIGEGERLIVQERLPDRVYALADSANRVDFTKPLEACSQAQALAVSLSEAKTTAQTPLQPWSAKAAAKLEEAAELAKKLAVHLEAQPIHVPNAEETKRLLIEKITEAVALIPRA